MVTEKRCNTADGADDRDRGIVGYFDRDRGDDRRRMTGVLCVDMQHARRVAVHAQVMFDFVRKRDRLNGEKRRGE